MTQTNPVISKIKLIATIKGVFNTLAIEGVSFIFSFRFLESTGYILVSVSFN